MQIKDELMKPHKKVKELTGIEMNLFRAPYGDYNNMLIETSNSCGYHVIQWDVERSDTVICGDEIYSVTKTNSINRALKPIYPSFSGPIFRIC